LSGLPFNYVTTEAPDPRDILWVNISVCRKTSDSRCVVVQGVLIVGLLVWGWINWGITKLVRMAIERVPVEEGSEGSAVEKGEFNSFIHGFLPVGLILLILIQIPNLFFVLAKRVIRFKSLSRVDEFTLLWNTCYRLVNIFFVFFGVSLIQAFNCLKISPELFFTKIAEDIMRQSTFLMNLMILATGQETMLQLFQWRSIIKNTICRPLFNLNKKSNRFILWLNECPPFEEGFLFGYFAPVLSYGLMTAMIYSFLAPIMLWVCSIFFLDGN